MKIIIRVVDVLGVLIIALPALILGSIIGICWGSFRQGLTDGKNRVS